jgi:hypothetical protein
MPYVALVGSHVVADVFLEARLGTLHQKRITSLGVRIDQLINSILSKGCTIIILLHSGVE